MNRVPCLCVCLAAAGATALAQSLTSNADFSARLADNASLPAAWTVPAEAFWSDTNEDGQSGQDSLRYQAPAPFAGKPVTQAVTLQPDTEYVLVAGLKSDGNLKPVVRVFATAEGKPELARIGFDGTANAWHRQLARFNSTRATAAVVELWADERQVQGTVAPAGRAGIDDVYLVPAGKEGGILEGQPPPPNYENVARGKPYSLQPQPGYSYCTDPGDKTQLTDGVYTVGYFWTQPTTVGWSNASPVVITLDLGNDTPIRGLSYNTAAGVAGVEWPKSILVLVSIDGRAFHSFGDLTSLSASHTALPAEGYGIRRFWTDGLKGHGRYVKLLIDPAGPYCFVDEIEVYLGEDAWAALPMPGEEIRYPLEYYNDNLMNANLKRRLGLDLETARAAVKKGELTADLRTRLLKEVEQIEKAIGELPPVEPEGFRTVFPLNELHGRIFALHGAVRRAGGAASVVAWAANPWDPLAPTALPETPPQAQVAVVAMKGETRAAALNLTNNGDQALVASLSFVDLPADSVKVHEVAWTDTREGTPVGAALPEVTPQGGAWPVSLPAGMTRQVWFSVTPAANAAAGEVAGRLQIVCPQAASLSVPFTVRVLDVAFPAEPRLHVAGWDYTDCDSQYGVTAANRDALITHLRERFVDSPWATASAMPTGTFGPTGELTKPPDTTWFDRWISRWPGARRYCVFNAVGDSIAGTKTTDPLFSAKVGSWIRFWTEHARQMHQIKPEQICLLLVDEPSQNDQDKVIVAWARAIKAAATGVVIWEDPTYKDPNKATTELMTVSDVLCPNRPMMLAEGKAFVDFYRQQRAAGRRLDLYSCSGPARLLDPYSYHRLQAWSCFDLGAESTNFWAFGDTGDGHSWNEYATKRTSFCPLFLGPDSATAGKHMEAIRESVGDFEYLALLRDRVEALAKAQPGHPQLAPPRELLASAAARVLTAKDVDKLEWKVPKDRALADQVRIEVGLMLEKLK